MEPSPKPKAGVVTVNVFDGRRQLIRSGTEVLLTVRDGAQNELFRNFVRGPGIQLELPFHNNFTDNYSIVAFSNGYEQAGFQPVVANPNSASQLDLMLLAKEGTFHFGGAGWADIVSKRPLLAKIFEASTARHPAEEYAGLMEQHPDRLACLLNLTTAMQQISLPRSTSLDYFKTFDLPVLAPDRMFGYAEAALVDQVRLAVQQGAFTAEPEIDLTLHGDATSSYKQIQFGEANVQLTFHDKNRKTIDGVDCIYVEPDIDYFKNTAAHILLEVIPNALTGNVTNPRAVFVLRWMAGRHAGAAEFDPLYTIEQ